MGLLRGEWGRGRGLLGGRLLCPRRRHSRRPSNSGMRGRDLWLGG